MPEKLDATDLMILDLLQRDASLTTGAIAERVNLSQSPCWRRIQRLEGLGLIRERVALLDRTALPLHTQV